MPSKVNGILMLINNRFNLNIYCFTKKYLSRVSDFIKLIKLRWNIICQYFMLLLNNFPFLSLSLYVVIARLLQNNVLRLVIILEKKADFFSFLI